MAIVRNIQHGGNGGNSIIVVANYSELPDPTTVSGKFYWCSASQGTSWLPGNLGGTYYNSGTYYSNGTTWEFINVPYQATLSEVNTGTNNDKFVTPSTLSNSNWAFTPARIAGKQDNLTDVNFGAFSNGLTAKATIVDADSTNIVDSADSNKSKKVTWLNIFTNYIKTKTDLLYRAYLEQFATIITSLPDTITLAQMNSWVRINVATDGNLTIPPNSSVPIPVGAYYYIRQSGVGRITLVAGAGVTLNSPENVLTTGSQYSVIKITKQATDNWMVEIGSSSFYNSFILPLLNSKTTIIVSDGQTTISAAVATEQKLKSYLIPANTIPDSSILALKTRMYKDSGGGAIINLRVYVNTSDTLVGATLIALVFANSPIVQDFALERTISIIGANLSILNNNYNAASDSTVANVTPSIIPFDRTANQYLIVSGQTANYLIPLYLKYVSLIKI